jgi:hypothetical protein
MYELTYHDGLAFLIMSLPGAFTTMLLLMILIIACFLAITESISRPRILWVLEWLTDMPKGRATLLGTICTATGILLAKISHH